jgi:hypothetical protein
VVGFEVVVLQAGKFSIHGGGMVLFEIREDNFQRTGRIFGAGFHFRYWSAVEY